MLSLGVARRAGGPGSRAGWPLAPGVAARVPGAWAGVRTLTSLLGLPVHDTGGHRLGRLRDLVVELGTDVDRVPVTQALVGHRRRGHVRVPWSALTVHEDRLEVAWPTDPGQTEPLAATELLLARDVLDGPVVAVDPPRRARIGDVLLEVGSGQAWVTGVDLTPGRALRRLLGRPDVAALAPVRLSTVHPLGARVRRAWLASPAAPVRSLDPDEVAELLTRAPVPHAREVARAVEPRVLAEAVRLLHPQVRGRLTGEAPLVRRTTRLGGWRAHLPRRVPGRSDDPDSEDG